MGEVKRYDAEVFFGVHGTEVVPTMEESTQGDYVLHSDYATLEAQCEALAKAEGHA